MKIYSNYNKTMNDLFVGNKYMHIFFRFVAAFIIAPILLYKGWRYKDLVIFGIGMITFIVDSYTFSLSLYKLKE